MKSNRINFKKLKYGQKVWCIQLGYCKTCEVIYSEKAVEYPIAVKKTYKGKTFYITYTQDGKSNKNDKFPSLFLRKPSLK